MIELIVPGPPPRKNDRHSITLRGKGKKCRMCGGQFKFVKLVNTTAFHEFCDALAIEWADGMNIRLDSDVWHIEVHSYWERMSHVLCPPNCGTKKTPCLGIGQGDADASIETVLDALQEIGALDNDVRFTRAVLEKHHDADNPRTEIKIFADPNPEVLRLFPNGTT